MKPIDKVKEVREDREGRGLCPSLEEYIHSQLLTVYWCTHPRVEFWGKQLHGDQPCKLEDWAVCPLNKEV